MENTERCQAMAEPLFQREQLLRQLQRYMVSYKQLHRQFVRLILI